MELSLIISAFIAGLLTFLAPCTLPLVPGYLGFISGVKTKDLTDISTSKEARWSIINNGIFFVLGFSVVFIMLGVLAGLVGQLFIGSLRPVLTKVGGVFVIFFGLFMLGAFKLPFLNATHRVRFPAWLQVGHPTSSFIIGAAFALGWTPCVGPILGSILLLASGSATVFSGGFLLAVFSLGLAISFLLVAFGFSHAATSIKKLEPALKFVSVIGGLFLLVLGYLLFTGNFGLTIVYGYKLLDFINYEGLLNYL